MDGSAPKDESLQRSESLLPTPETAVLWMTAFSAGSSPALVEQAAALLNPREIVRAERMRLAEARAEYVLGRALLRSLLGERLGCSAAEVPLDAPPQHKPRLSAACSPLQFNLSHAGGRIALAMTHGIAVGVDLEIIDREVEFLEIAGSHFASAEYAALLMSCGEARAHRFFRIWTRKEAVVKAAGDGLTLPLDGFDVSPAMPEELALTIDSVEAGVGMWHVRDVAVDGPFAAAIALAKPGIAMHRCLLNEECVAAVLRIGAGARQTRVA